LRLICRHQQQIQRYRLASGSISVHDLSFKPRGAGAAGKPMYRITDEKYAVHWAMEKKA
jgi:hypothetical protein